MQPHLATSRPDTPWLPVLAALLGLAVAVRRPAPIPALLLALLSTAGADPLGVMEPALAAILLTAYTVGTVSERATAAAVAIGCAVLLCAGFAVAERLLALDSQGGPVPSVIGVLAGIAVGQATATRRQLLVALKERALRAELALEEEARRRVAEERMHIAREVHDLVAHHISVVNVQAGVAAHLLRERPEAAGEALGHVRTAARTVLDELGAVLDVLRGSGDPRAPLEPLPGLADLDRLIDSFGGAGLRVDRTVSGAPRSCPPAVDLCAYRILQESLTNARKYGRGRAKVTMSYTDQELTINVRNECADARERDVPGTGHGLIGMRERIASVGGTLVAGPAPAGEFAVLARLPLDGSHLTDGNRDDPSVAR
ncbi:two-component sensor histidine kinase [Spongiactinospora gelatinilytica]|uniref:histidine kinase n=1 Tax=Spongiactinospora gelatinilytica TaxID=2666298 RepID=A0A2W2I5B2_9ACTN|nr:histidine kinase [Spongiactinospora gelatinilytica]PZG53347.1 two-component sensor histidine kinase [Spongiactinospora gelatinilytica]